MINAFKNTKARAGNLDLSMMFRNPKMQAEMPTSSPMPINDPKLGQIPDIGINGQPGMGAVADTPPIGIQRDLPPIMPIEPQKNPYTDLM